MAACKNCGGNCAVKCVIDDNNVSVTTVNNKIETKQQNTTVTLSKIDSDEAKSTYNDAAIVIPPLEAGHVGIHLPVLDDVTTEDVDGTGAFDVYMRAGKNQLDTQYNLGRIKGADYTQAYISMTQMMIAEANKFVLGKVAADIAARMFDRQWLSLGYDIHNKTVQTEKLEIDKELIKQQIEELKLNGAVDRESKEAAIQKIYKDTSMVCQEEAELIKNGSVDRVSKQKQIQKLDIDIKATGQQISETKASGSVDRGLKTAQTQKTLADENLVERQLRELQQNGVSERKLKKAQAQTQVKQAELYCRQIDGFSEKAANDAAKTAFDAWAVHAVEEPVGTYGTVYANPTTPQAALNKLMGKV